MHGAHNADSHVQVMHMSRRGQASSPLWGPSKSIAHRRACPRANLGQDPCRLVHLPNETAAVEVIRPPVIRDICM
jgi:hypothetical protein